VPIPHPVPTPILRPAAAIGVAGLLLVMAAGATQAQNLVTNPGFDTGVAGWGPAVAIAWDGTRDADGNPHSGSAQVTDVGGFILTCFPIIRQCIPGTFTAGDTYSFGGKLFVRLGQPIVQPPTGGWVEVGWFADPTCSTPPVGGGIGPTVNATGAWASSTGVSTVPPGGAAAAELRGATCDGDLGSAFLINFDDMFLTPAPVAVVPTLDGRWLAAFAVLLTALACMRLRRWGTAGHRLPQARSSERS
jgi:hypothetical protein